MLRSLQTREDPLRYIYSEIRTSADDTREYQMTKTYLELEAKVSVTCYCDGTRISSHTRSPGLAITDATATQYHVFLFVTVPSIPSVFRGSPNTHFEPCVQLSKDCSRPSAYICIHILLASPSATNSRCSSALTVLSTPLVILSLQRAWRR
ncbi:uncharacterized protein LAESUDRAFT_501696 [Laetiporus sulphureus 93-53]|uniref:Uncharacterized protein n=1 Tax=Laetiporus sulphureus 93-53 TaxID=1314785 RepID=A0A165BGD2_9APHY|nr:uncharacterized protein LAESUDRAFT_501696 [Laetiporus sulphureus 93-53]KZT01008.1 hypothetical protein LAESUDRAFT_501696 [Laetiporus sulphureus 93-53]